MMTRTPTILMVRRIGLLAALIALAGMAPAQGRANPGLPFVLKEVGPGVWAAIDGPGHNAGSNSGFVIGDDGVLVIDAFFHEQAARALVAQIHRLTPMPIRYVVNTHYHLDHTGGDAVLRKAGAIIIAHRNVREWLRSDNLRLFGNAITPELKAQIAALPLPDLVTAKDLTIWLGSRKIVVRTVLGHTGGDLMVDVPDAKVVFTGDLLWRKIPPNLIDGSVAEWITTDEELTTLPDSQHIRYVPGHGDVADIKDVRDFRDYLLRLRQLVSQGRRAGLSGEALVRVVIPTLRTYYSDWSISDRAGSAEVRDMDEELAGTKHRPVARPD